MNAIYRLVYVLAYGFWYVMSLLPLEVLYFLSDVLYLLVAHVVKYRHRIISTNIRSSFPDRTDDEVRQIELDFYHWFCDYLVETLKLMTIKPAQIQRRMRFEGMDQLNRTLESGQSCAIYLGHYCNWEWMSSLPYWTPKQIACCELYHPLENEYFDRLFKFVRERHNSICIPMRDALRKIVEFKNNNQTIVLGYIADQVPMWNNIYHWLDFLNHDTPVLTGAERIARKNNQACFYGDLRRIRRGYYVCEMKPITLTPNEMPQWGITDAYFRMLEQTIKRQPELWLWSHNRWKRSHEDFDREWEVRDGRVVKRKINPDTN